MLIGGVGYLVQWIPSRGVQASSPMAFKERPGFTGLAAPGADAQPSSMEQDPAQGANNSESDSGELKHALKQAAALITEKNMTTRSVR